MTIDWWTLGLQTVNVAILIWLLQRFFWRPVAAIIAERRDGTRRTLADAEAIQARANAALTENEQTRAGFARERDAILAAARAEAESVKAVLLVEARQQAGALEAAARAAIERETEAGAETRRRESVQLALSIAERLAARLDGAAVRASFLDWLAREIVALPVDGRGSTFDVNTATDLEPVEQERIRARIAMALGEDASITFHTDPTLIAGLELHGPNLVIRNSWRADLQRMSANLTELTAR